MNENKNNDSTAAPPSAETPEEMTRRRFFERLCIGLGAVCAAILGVPLIGFVVAPLFRKSNEPWIAVGKIDDFKIGATVSVPYADPSPLPWAGVTSRGAAWLRRESADEFAAFSVHCTHMGCPVRWLAGAELFMCPCHGGVYYKDGTVAAGPPPKPLFRLEVRVTNGIVEIKSSPVPITTTL